MKIRNYLKHGRPAYMTSVAAAFFCGMTLFSCSDDLVKENAATGNTGEAVGFEISDVQNEAMHNAATRAGGIQASMIPGLASEDLVMQKLPVQDNGGLDVSLVETTLPGIETTRPDAAGTRANISEKITDHFTSIGFRGATSTPDEPWFYNEDTDEHGKPVRTQYWDWGKRYGKFYGISPKISDDDPKITLSPQNGTQAPYIDFEAETDITGQKDLMTACSETAEYATRGQAPHVPLRFYHALTAVRFKVGSNLSWSKTITKVEIQNAMSKGRYTLGTASDRSDAAWSNLSSPATFTLDGVQVSTSLAENKLILGEKGDNYTFYMIPQTLDGVKVNIYFSDGGKITANLKGTWKAGTTKTYAISEKNSSWEYELTGIDAATIAYDETQTGNFGIRSYRKDPSTNTLQIVPWKVVSYQESHDGGKTFGAPTTEKPDWLVSLTKTEGPGNVTSESGTAKLTVNLIDKLAEYNEKLKNSPAKGTATNPYNLASPSGDGTNESSANSYLISSPGYYCLPLVYGNSIKNGAENPGSYIAPKTGTAILDRFRDYNGDPILSSAIRSKDGKSPNGVKIVWADKPAIIDGLELDLNSAYPQQKYLKFHVAKENIQNANVVVAVTLNGTVVWSWHLWFADDQSLSTTPVYSNKNTYDLAEHTLGFVYDKWRGSKYQARRIVRLNVEQTTGNGTERKKTSVDISQDYGNLWNFHSTFYQYGRKDALPGTDQLAEGSFTPDGGDNMSAKNGIQNPATLYTDNGKGHNESTWRTISGLNGYFFFNLWSMDCTGYDQNRTSVKKTVYDPCPAGFSIPAGDVFRFMLKDDVNKTSSTNSTEYNLKEVSDHVWTFYTNHDGGTIKFAETGFRDAKEGGILKGQRAFGYYWTATVRTDVRSGTCAYAYFQNTQLNTYGTGVRATTQAVRPMKEK